MPGVGMGAKKSGKGRGIRTAETTVATPAGTREQARISRIRATKRSRHVGVVASDFIGKVALAAPSNFPSVIPWS